MHRTTSGAVALLVIAAGCGSHHRQNGGSGSSAPAYFVIGDTDEAPAACDRGLVAHRLADLFTVISTGQRGIAEEFLGLGSDAPFLWFSFTDRVPGGIGRFAAVAPDVPDRRDDALTREQLELHLLQRHAAGDRFSMLGVEFNGWNPDRGTVSISPILWTYDRGADSTVHHGAGKAEYHCETASFVVLAFGTTPEHQWRPVYDHMRSQAAAQGSIGANAAPGETMNTSNRRPLGRPAQPTRRF